MHGTVGGGGSATLIFSVDGSSENVNVHENTTALPVQYHELFFSSPNLSNGSHTLSITQYSTWEVSIDYFLVIPSSDADVSGETLFYDDASPAIVYSGSWSSTAGTSQDLQGTLHGAITSGSTATLKFNGKYTQVSCRRLLIFQLYRERVDGVRKYP